MSGKRYIPIAEYQRLSGLSYATVNHLLKSGQLAFITTESGQRRVDTQPLNAGQDAVIARLEEQERLIKALCSHFGMVVDRR